MAKKNGNGGGNAKLIARQVLPVLISELIPYDRNARLHSETQIQQIVASLREYGWTNPVLIDENKRILAGHGRVEAAKRMNMTHAPCIVLSGLTDAQKRAYVIADNKLALNAGWDEGILKMELMSLEMDGLDFRLTGFEQFEMNNLVNPNESQADSRWGGMPDYNSKNESFRTILVHFRDQASMDKFAEIIGQKLTAKTRFMWYPFEERESWTDKRYTTAPPDPEQPEAKTDEP